MTASPTFYRITINDIAATFLRFIPLSLQHQKDYCGPPSATKQENMAKNYVKRYIWLIDVISRHGHITRREISDLCYRSTQDFSAEEYFCDLYGSATR